MLPALLLALLLMVPTAADAGPLAKMRERRAMIERLRSDEMARPIHFTGTKHGDIAYGRGERQTLDLYLPAQTPGSKMPLYVFIHGGGWVIGNKAQAVHNKPEAFTRAGFAVAAPNYRLAPRASIDDMLSDLAQALVMLRSQAAKYGYDPDRIILSGHSAGAHLAALLVTDTRALKQAKVPLGAIRGVVLLDGAGYSLTRMPAQDIGIRMYQAAFGKDQSKWGKWAPLTYVPSAETLPPFFIAHIDAREESRIEANLLAEAVRKRGVRAEIAVANGKSHRDINMEFGLASDPVTTAARQFMTDVLR
jgi:arylformamidase